MLDVREQKVEGWKDIGTALGFDERTARRYAKRRKDPLPVYWYLDRVVAHATALRDWVKRQEVPFQLRVVSSRVRLCPLKSGPYDEKAGKKPLRR